jgi:hypothetical protein
VTVPGTPPDPGIPSPVLPSTPTAPVEGVAKPLLERDLSPLDVKARRS